MELYEQFVQKLNDDWEPRFLRHGPSFVGLSAIGNRSAFVDDVTDAVEAVLTGQIGRAKAQELLPSKDTFRRLLFAYNPDTQWRSKTRLALCLYIGFASWEAFEASRQYMAEKEPAVLPLPIDTPALPVAAIPPPAVRPNRQTKWGVGALLLGCLAGMIAWFSMTPRKSDDYAKASLTIKKREGATVPTTLLFRYDVSNLSFDSAFLCVQGCVGCPQRIPIQQATGMHSVTFMVTGIKRAVLEINGKAAKELFFPVYTKGWGGRIITPDRWYPYQTQEQIVRGGNLHLPPAQFTNPDEYNNYETHFSNCRDFGITGDSSVLEVRVRNSPADGGLGCCDIGWTLSDSVGRGYNVHILQRSCTTFAQLRINDQVYTPTTDFNLLANLGQDVSQWGVLKIVLINQQMRVLFNEKPILAVPYNGRIGKVKHLSCKFMGSGRVDQVKLSNTYSGQVAYAEEF